MLSQRNGRGRRDGRGEKEKEEAKKRKMPEDAGRIVNRMTRDSHNEKHNSNTHGTTMKRLESCSDDCDDPRKIRQCEMERQRI
jgi:hypothetical protein